MEKSRLLKTVVEGIFMSEDFNKVFSVVVV